MKNKLDAAMTTLFMIVIISLIWYGLEMMFYGKVQEDVVDTIILMLFAPIVYKAVSNNQITEKRIENNEKEWGNRT